MARFLALLYILLNLLSFVENGHIYTDQLTSSY